jgi:hypothetical protein
MSIFEDNLWLVAIFFAFIVFCAVAMILRNRAAKIDSVGRSEKDTVINSVSIDAKENTTKLN